MSVISMEIFSRKLAVRQLSFRDIFIYFLIHLNENFDDDLLQDTVELLKKWFISVSFSQYTLRSISMALHINFLMKNHILSLLRHIPLETPASVCLPRPIVPRISSLIHFYRAKNVLLHHTQVCHWVPDAVLGSCVVFVEGKWWVRRGCVRRFTWPYSWRFLLRFCLWCICSPICPILPYPQSDARRVAGQRLLCELQWK